MRISRTLGRQHKSIQLRFTFWLSTSLSRTKSKPFSKFLSPTILNHHHILTMAQFNRNLNEYRRVIDGYYPGRGRYPDHPCSGDQASIAQPRPARPVWTAPVLPPFAPLPSLPPTPPPPYPCEVAELIDSWLDQVIDPPSVER